MMGWEEWYIALGNVKKEYKHEPRIVIPRDVFRNPRLFLKMYEMIKQEEQAKPLMVVHAQRFLLEEITKGRLDPLIGLGFAILSTDMLNVSRWDTTYPIVLKNQVYLFEPESLEELQSEELSNNKKIPYFGVFDIAKKLGINEIGPFCIWELGIVNHEKEAWKKYLASKRQQEDKKKYLVSMISGPL